MPPPRPYLEMKEAHPELVEAYERFAESCARAGPLDAKTVAMLKLATSLGAGLAGAAHAHTRKALEAGCTAAELQHVATLGAPTVGFPAMMRNRSWVREVTDAK